MADKRTLAQALVVYEELLKRRLDLPKDEHERLAAAEERMLTLLGIYAHSIVWHSHGDDDAADMHALRGAVQTHVGLLLDEMNDPT